MKYVNFGKINLMLNVYIKYEICKFRKNKMECKQLISRDDHNNADNIIIAITKQTYQPINDGVVTFKSCDDGWLLNR